MAGSRKWFVYTDDKGSNFAIQLDESNTEAVNGGTQDFVAGLALTDALPRNIKPRKIFYSNLLRTRTISAIALTPTIYQAVLNGSANSIADPIAGGAATLGLSRASGERRTLPIPNDTGLDDGDAD